MAKYRILVIAHSLKGNKIASHGDIVDVSQLTSSESELEEAGFIELVNEKEASSEEVLSKEVVDEVVVSKKDAVKQMLKPKK